MECNSRLIIVEGLPGSGKSTTAAMIAQTLKKNGMQVVCADENDKNHPADFADYDFPDFAAEKSMICKKWAQFVKEADPRILYVFNSVLLQNPMCETMMRFGLDERASREYIQMLSEIIQPLNPVIVYLDRPDVRQTIDKVLDERGEDWLRAVIAYHTMQGYGKQNRLTGFDGYIQCLEERKKRELRILQSLNVKYFLICHEISKDELMDFPVSLTHRER